ncbi:MAG TPA: chemotaxis protein CheW [Geobacteraceae bacterium]|nr:chemotaxis protein CheW [Geobacteraceae bacterium]
MEATDRLIVFTLSGNKYALYLRNVAEVMEPPRIFPLPHAPLFVPGIINFHGNMVSLLDLARFLVNAPRDDNGKLLVLDTGIAHLALWVDAVENVGSADVVLEEFASDEALVEKVLAMADGEVRLLSVEKLLEKLEEILSARPIGT